MLLCKYQAGDVGQAMHCYPRLMLSLFSNLSALSATTCIQIKQHLMILSFHLQTSYPRIVLPAFHEHSSLQLLFVSQILRKSYIPRTFKRSMPLVLPPVESKEMPHDGVMDTVVLFQHQAELQARSSLAIRARCVTAAAYARHHLLHATIETK
jgi:hypothetical protein